ncbi:MAG: hypothetical protein KGJ60_09960, partial [Verrucomicrobiota bacterium]|nr:hypothetical protein [Verrucomicrobiota bacterium]
TLTPPPLGCLRPRSSHTTDDRPLTQNRQQIATRRPKKNPNPPKSAKVGLADGSFAFAASPTNGGLLLPGEQVGLAVQASTDLMHWIILINSFALSNGVLQWQDLASTNIRRAFTASSSADHRSQALGR